MGGNPKTTISGIIGLLGTLMAVIGASFYPAVWAQVLMTIGLALNGGNGIGNILSMDSKTLAQAVKEKIGQGQKL